ncbi:MAG: alpha/beta hydrolase [Alphaproteobacteria bacterium]|nr:alpha/beta hydrolase [Alphaproteobacteria bacterium]
MAQPRKITISNGVTLHALEAGQGTPLIMIPGWSQSAAEYGRNIDALARTRRVIALDMRGHGESSNPEGGYRIQRLAKDLAEVIDALGLTSVDVLGHSMGSSVIWSYLDLFGPQHLRKLVIVDQAPMVAALPAWSDDDRRRYGCLLPDVQSVAGFCDTVRATSSVDGTMNILRGMFTAAISDDDLRWIATENLKMPRAAAADLLFNHCLSDWRDVIAATRLPALVIGGRKSIFSAESQEWIAAVNPNARAVIFEETEGGGHFMFFENPDRFNREVEAFLAT